MASTPSSPPNHDIYSDKTEYVKKEQVKLKEPPIEDLSASEAAAVEKQKVRPPSLRSFIPLESSSKS
jgi:hypothetical protein